MEKFKSSYSKGMLLASCLLLIVLLSASFVVIDQLVDYQIGSLYFIARVLIIGLILATLLYAFTAQIESICLTKEHVIIQKKVGKIVIPRRDIIHVQPKRSLKRDVRVFGGSGPFGYLGWFWNRESGRYLAFIKDGNSMIEIKTTRKTYVVSCDDYKTVIEQINAGLA